MPSIIIESSWTKCVFEGEHSLDDTIVWYSATFKFYAGKMQVHEEKFSQVTQMPIAAVVAQLKQHGFRCVADRNIKEMVYQTYERSTESSWLVRF